MKGTRMELSKVQSPANITAASIAVLQGSGQVPLYGRSCFGCNVGIGTVAAPMHEGKAQHMTHCIYANHPGSVQTPVRATTERVMCTGLWNAMRLRCMTMQTEPIHQALAIRDFG